MKRYNQVHNGTYEPRSEMVEETLGDWVWYEDVERLVEERQDLLEALIYCRHKIAHINEGSELYSPCIAIEIADDAIAKAKGDM
jgi:hypothetical protein